MTPILKSQSKKIFIIMPILFLFSSCSGLEKAEKERLKEQNAKGEYIYRKPNEVFYQVSAPRPKPKEPYPWERPGEETAK